MAFTALDALREEYEVYPVVDAIGGTWPEAHRAGLDRVIQAGGQPISWVSLACELQRDWGRQETVADVVEIVLTDRLRKRVTEGWLRPNREAARATGPGTWHGHGRCSGPFVLLGAGTMGPGRHRARLGDRRAGRHRGQDRPADDRPPPTGIAALQWVVNGYVLSLAALLLIGGSLGDQFGRRRVFPVGVLWFALASAACGLAPGVVFWS